MRGAGESIARSITLEGRTGTLAVETEPSTEAEVWLDGKKLGTAPDMFTVLAGDHELRVVATLNGQKLESTRKVTVTEGKEQTAVVALKAAVPAATATVPVSGSQATGVVTTSTGIKMVSIPGGTFTMGSPAGEADRGSDEGPQHQVTVSAFRMGQYEVTQSQWQAVMGSNPSSFKGGSLPVEKVSWYDVLVYCNKLSMQEGLTPCYSINGSSDPSRWGAVPTSSDATWNKADCNFSANGYRLPTEAEWEYACRAGTSTATAYGNSLDSTQANFNGEYPYGGAKKGPYLQKTTVAGSYKPNAWGLYDMHGNVWEWCHDWYGAYSSGSQRDPLGASSGGYRVYRGGGWFSDGQYLRSAIRNNSSPYGRGSYLGFRLVCRP